MIPCIKRGVKHTYIKKRQNSAAIQFVTKGASVGACRCDACGAVLIADPARKACPSCSAVPFVARPIDRLAGASDVGALGRKSAVRYFAMRIVPLVLLVTGIVWGLERYVPRSSDPRKTDAVTACQVALRGVATNPSKANIPYREPQGTGGDFLVSWPIGAGLQLQNGFGALVDASASCIYSVPKGRVTALSVNGKSVL